MEMRVPLKYANLFRGLPLSIYKFRQEGDKLVATMFIGFTISKPETMNTKSFLRVFNEIEVLGGYKRWKKKEIDLETKKTVHLSNIRVSPEALELIKKAANIKGLTVTRYVIGTILKNAIEAIESEEALTERISATRKPGATRGG